MALHEQSVGATDEWFTPERVFQALGVTFDVDVSHPGVDVLPWVPAREVITADSLERDWTGFVWMNPPFGARNGLIPWLRKFLKHGHGVALVPDRTSAPWWQDYCPRADLALQVRRKIKFVSRDGRPNRSPAQGTTLLACGAHGVQALFNAETAGLGSLWSPIRRAA